MEPEVIAALVSASFSLVMAILGIFISKNAQKIANRASEDSKRVEQIRLKATEVGEELLSKIASIIILADTVLIILNSHVDKGLTKDELDNYFKPIGKNVSELINLLYSSAIYTTAEIRHTLSETVKPILAGNVDFKDWDKFVNRLKENHQLLATLFFDTYLKGTF